MPFIAYDLKALDDAPMIARASGIEETAAVAGLLRMWAYCWSHATDVLTGSHLAGMFGGDPARLSTTLTDFGYLEPTNGSFRVRGADRYLRINEAKSKAGKARVATAKRDKSGRLVGPAEKKTVQRVLVQQPADIQQTSSEKPALTLSTEHGTLSTEELKTSAPASRSRLHSLQLVLETEYLSARGSKYKHGGAKDTDALKALMPIATDEEVRDRWRYSLGASGWQNCSTFAQLGSKWNDLTAPATTKTQAAFDPNGGIMRSGGGW